MVTIIHYQHLFFLIQDVWLIGFKMNLPHSQIPFQSSQRLLLECLLQHIAGVPDGEECYKTDRNTLKDQHYNKVQLNAGCTVRKIVENNSIVLKLAKNQDTLNIYFAVIMRGDASLSPPQLWMDAIRTMFLCALITYFLMCMGLKTLSLM